MMASVYQQIIHFEYNFATKFSIYANAELILLFLPWREKSQYKFTNAN